MKYFILFLLLITPVVNAQGEDELINPRDLIPDIVIDMRYASADHEFRSLPEGDILLPKMYTANECLVVYSAIAPLKMAQDSLRNIREHNGTSYPEGIGIKLWDGYRPRAVQYLFWDIYPNGAYIANPASGSKHNRGGAIDLTLIDYATGEELLMPTDFDDFSNRASHSYNSLSADARANRQLLVDVLVDYAGFNLYSAEWWHYEVPGANGYPLLDFQLK